MGLLDLLLQNKSILDIEVPSVNGGPINVPTNNFVQHYLPNHSYLSSIQGAPDNGSALSSTLDNTNLDTTDAASTTNIAAPSPDLITQYPQYSHGEFGGASTLYSQIWSETNPYISQFNPNTQPNTLSETGLDNDNPSYTSTTSLPYNITEYPSLASGEFRGASSQYVPLYGPNSTYLNTLDVNTQPNTLNKTGLDNTNLEAAPTTLVPNNISSPTDYSHLPTLYISMGEYGNYPWVDVNQNYSPSGFTYLQNIPFLQNNNSTTILAAQYSALNEDEGIINPIFSNPFFGPFFTNISNIFNLGNGLVPNSLNFPTDYSNTPSQANLGEFNGAPSQYNQSYNSTNTYGDTISTIVNPLTNPQVNTLDETGLDIENPNSSPSSFVPNDISAPTDYNNTPPQAQMGEFGGAPSQYTQLYNPNSTYLDNININTQVDTLNNTGLDVENSALTSTTVIPNNISAPTNYSNTPSQAQMGEFGGAPSQYSQQYNPNSTYLDNININTQVNTLDETGLDVEDGDFDSTTVIPNNISAPTNYNNGSSQIQMGEFGGAPSQYIQQYYPSEPYLDEIPTVIDPLSNPQINTLGETDLDVENPTSSPTTVIPNNISAPTDYGNVPPQAQMGEFGGAPSQYTQLYTPFSSYLFNFNPNTQVNTLDDTGLNIGDNQSAPTSYIPGDPTVYPYINSVNLGEFNGPPSFFNQNYTPDKYYLYPSNLSNLKSLIQNSQIKSLNTSSLDIPSTNVVVDTITNYPIISSTQILTPVNLGEFGSGPDKFHQNYTPNKTYLTSLNQSVQIDTFKYSGLDVENDSFTGFVSSSYGFGFINSFTPPLPDVITNYPSQYVTGFTGSGANSYNQKWSPKAYINTYYGYMKTNNFAALVA